MVTVETAIGLISLMLVLVLALAAAVTVRERDRACHHATEVARLAATGEADSAGRVAAASGWAPTTSVTREDRWVHVAVSTPAPAPLDTAIGPLTCKVRTMLSEVVP